MKWWWWRRRRALKWTRLPSLNPAVLGVLTSCFLGWMKEDQPTRLASTWCPSGTQLWVHSTSWYWCVWYGKEQTSGLTVTVTCSYLNCRQHKHKNTQRTTPEQIKIITLQDSNDPHHAETGDRLRLFFDSTESSGSKSVAPKYGIAAWKGSISIN